MQHNTHMKRNGNAVVGVVAGLAIVGALIWGAYSLFGGTSLPTENGLTIAEPFLTAVRTGKEDEALQSTTAEFKSDMGKENFRKFVAKNPILKEELGFANSVPVKMNNLDRYECAFGKKGSSGAGAKVRVLLAPEQGKWKVERLIVE